MLKRPTLRIDDTDIMLADEAKRRYGLASRGDVLVLGACAMLLLTEEDTADDVLAILHDKKRRTLATIRKREKRKTHAS